MISAYYLVRWYYSRNSDLTKLRKSRANKIAKKHLAEADKYLAGNELSGFYEAISTALYGYFADKFNISVAELSQEKIIELLEQYDEAGEVRKETGELLESSEMARFAPSAAIPAKELYNRAVDLIATIENLEI